MVSSGCRRAGGMMDYMHVDTLQGEDTDSKGQDKERRVAGLMLMGDRVGESKRCGGGR